MKHKTSNRFIILKWISCVFSGFISLHEGKKKQKKHADGKRCMYAAEQKVTYMLK